MVELRTCNQHIYTIAFFQIYKQFPELCVVIIIVPKDWPHPWQTRYAIMIILIIHGSRLCGRPFAVMRLVRCFLKRSPFLHFFKMMTDKAVTETTRMITTVPTIAPVTTPTSIISALRGTSEIVLTKWQLLYNSNSLVHVCITHYREKFDQWKFESILAQLSKFSWYNESERNLIDPKTCKHNIYNILSMLY